MVGGAERPESALCEPGALPLVVSGQVDVLPAERGEKFEQLRVKGLSVPSQGLGRPLYVHRVPERDGGRDEREAAGPITLLLEAAVPDLTEAAEEDGSGEGVARLTFVEAGVNAAAQFDALQPGKDEQCPFDPAQLAESERETVLTRVAAQLAKHERSRHGTLLDRSGEAKHFVSVGADGFQVNGSADQRGECLVFDLSVRKVELGVAQIANAWSEAKAEQVHEGEDVIGEARGIGVVLLDPQFGFMVQQTIENIGGIAYPDVDDLGTKRRILIRDVGVEELAGFSAVFGIDVAGALGFAASLESLPVR